MISQFYIVSNMCIKNRITLAERDFRCATIGKNSLIMSTANANDTSHYELIIDSQYDEIPSTPQKRLNLIASPTEINDYDYIADSQYDEIHLTPFPAVDHFNNDDMTITNRFDKHTAIVSISSTLDHVDVGSSTVSVNDCNFYESVIENMYSEISSQEIGHYTKFSSMLGCIER